MAGCFYCGAPACADERGVPDWTSEALGFREVALDRARSVPAGAVPAASPLGEYRERVLCDGCLHRLDRLEEQARPIVGPMLRGEAQACSAPEQELLAAWGARRAFAILAVEGKGHGVPREHRRTLLERSLPHRDTFVGLGYWPGNRLLTLAARMRIGADRGGSIVAYNALAVFGALVVKVFGVRRRPRGSSFRVPPGLLVPSWPAQAQAASWPPLWRLDELGVQEVFAFDHLRVAS